MESLIDINQSLIKEVLVSSDTFGQFWNVCVWDYTTGTSLYTYKNCSTVSNGLTFLKDDYMLCAIHNKPYMFYWNLKAKSQPNKINTPGFVTCMTSTSCGKYIALGIEEKVFIFQSYSGRLITILAKHLQNVSCIKFSANNKYLITSSDDTTILVWNFNEVLNMEKEYLKPVHSWNNHSMRVNDLYISQTSGRVVSASADQTCKFWDLNSEKPFATQSVLFQSAPQRCVLDHSESNLYVGLVNGQIFKISIKKVVQDSNKLVEESNENATFIGHKQKINCLAISLDDFTMASGSDDSTIKIWDCLSRQCIKVINHSGPVTNLFFKPRTLFFNDESNIVPNLVSRYTNEPCPEMVIQCKRVKPERQLSMDDFLNQSSLHDLCHEEYFELKAKCDSMKKINGKIYNYALEKIFNSN